MSQKYVKQIIRACGEKADYVIVLKMENMKEAIKRVEGKIQNKIDFGGLYLKGTYENIEINIFKTGKIMVKNISSEEELKKVLDKIFI
ncbi:MAG: hypothetical protein QXX09_05070 [Candidatus Methanomethylicia archaeon]